VLVPDTDSRLLIAGERAEELRREYLAAQPAAPAAVGPRAGATAPKRTYRRRVLATLLRRAPDETPVYHA
jgi:hypothetical protein